MVKVLKVSKDKEVLKQIFCSNEDAKYWNDDEYDSLINLFDEGDVGFGDAGYNTSINYGDYYILVNDGYSLPVLSREMAELNIDIVDNKMFNYDIVVECRFSDELTLRQKQILYALKGDIENCVVVGEKAMEIEKEENAKSIKVDDVKDDGNDVQLMLNKLSDYVISNIPPSRVEKIPGSSNLEKALNYIDKLYD